MLSMKRKQKDNSKFSLNLKKTLTLELRRFVPTKGCSIILSQSAVITCCMKRGSGKGYGAHCSYVTKKPTSFTKSTLFYFP